MKRARLQLWAGPISRERTLYVWLCAMVACMLLTGCSPKGGRGEPANESRSTQTESTPPTADDANFVGVWRLQPGEDLLQAAKKLGKPPPSMELEAYADGTFDLVGRAGDSQFEVSGEYFVDGREVTLRAKEVNGEPVILKSESEPRGGRLSEDGQTFVDDGGWVWKREPKDG